MAVAYDQLLSIPSNNDNIIIGLGLQQYSDAALAVDYARVVSTLYYKLTVFVQRLTSEDTEALLQRDKL